jgi:DNA primase large subunit
MPDLGLAARYPFLPGSEVLLGELQPSLEDVVRDAAYEPARALGRASLLSALRSAGSSADPPAVVGADEALPEVRVLAFLYTRMLVAASAAPQMTSRRWGEGEARRVAAALHQGAVPPEELSRFGAALDLEVHEDGSRAGRMVLSLPSYLKASSRLRDPKYRLVAQELEHGTVHVDRERAVELLAEATRTFLSEELDPLQLDAGLREELRTREAELFSQLARLAPARGTAGFGPVLRPDLFPPCMREIRSLLDRSQPVPHAGRFALASFMNKVGADVETIVDAYRGAPNFKEGVTRYQVTQISRHDGGAGYTPPDCATLIANGLCRAEKDPADPPLCADPTRLRNPLNYYRLRLRSAGPPPSAPTVTSAGEASPAAPAPARS